MSLRTLVFYLILSGSCLFGEQDSPVRQAQDRPNVLFIFSDDQCFETIGAYGHMDIDMPNLDRLAKEGVSFFSNAYNMGGWSGTMAGS